MKITETFYDWCVNNNHQDILNCWDNERNYDSPKDIGRATDKKRYFICPDCGKSWLRTVSDITKHDHIPSCNYCNSFGVWCEKHERRDLLKRWDWDKNQCSPYEVRRNTNSSYWFKCPRGIHSSELKRIDYVEQSFVTSRCKQCNSVGQWGIDTFGPDFLEKYWSSKNTKDPMQISRAANTKIWIKCQNTDYHQDYLISCSNFTTKNAGCPYCAGRQVDPHDSLGAVHPESQKFWFQKKNTPFQFMPSSAKQVYWKCRNCGKVFKKSIGEAVDADYLCPTCSKKRNESKYERQVREYLENKFGKDDVRNEAECSLRPKNPKTGHYLRYDNEVVSLKLIIQVNGSQHYDPNNSYVSNQRESYQKFDYRKNLDEYKKKYAIEHGYSFLAIPYWEFDNKNTWKKSIDGKIVQING